MNKEWSTVDVLRHARHDWLNKIQLIKGNLALNKTERIKEIIEEIVVETQQEANLSNLQIPQFAALLLTFNWEAHSFLLEFEVLNEIKCVGLNDQVLTDWTSSFFACLHTAVESYGENHLSVSIETQENGVRFFFDFSGIIKDKGRLEQFLDGNQHNLLTIKVLEFSQQELALEVFMPSTKDDK
jgi:stage 0 sporulation protein B (sporulation initiation phosphotransferase)